MENKVNFQIPSETITQVVEKVNEIDQILNPFLVGLTPEDRQNLPKMGDGTTPFVLKCLEYSKTNPEFAPPFLAQDGFASDMEAWSQLMAVLRPIKQLYDALDDTTMQAGAESYVAALSYYNSVKYAARSGIPGSKAISDDLKIRFAKNGNRKS